ncbi:MULTISPECIES: hypothetical protein [unclassified Pseudoalteromonas]|uniref:hypothetical protein n=1 Tax=unclassified Pseudoalteromonas TaxID=194690 RepID=UPI0006D5FC5C|nr:MULTISPECIES: hypothetical protein [unclassified Pseudoalteromonas]KPV94435.1 hypothetical protein AN214_03533 [Pseudoalteromonas sp. P1-9]MCF6458174.1 hypothetical protein [Pseudoalteromonas sp. MMG024]
MKKLCCSIALGVLMSFSFAAQANIDDVSLPNDFQVRMALEDDYPMIISGFVKQDLDSVMAFYRNTLGEPETITEDIGRYTYFYTVAGKRVKIGFYQQESWCEVSIMMTK